MLCNRLKQFREYNKLDCKLVSEILGITEEEYRDFENNKSIPTIDIITQLTRLYKVTVNEFYGYTPRLTIQSENNDITFEDVDETTLKMSDLSWDEARLVLYYRAHKDDNDEIIKKILEKDKDN
ncbi:MAG: helix-turn-helix transcriptional regulator [Acutalibacteraceae bacterium]